MSIDSHVGYLLKRRVILMLAISVNSNIECTPETSMQMLKCKEYVKSLKKQVQIRSNDQHKNSIDKIATASPIRRKRTIIINLYFLVMISTTIMTCIKKITNERILFLVHFTILSHAQFVHVNLF